MTSIITGSEGFIAKKLIEKLHGEEDLIGLNRDDGDLSIISLNDLINKETKRIDLSEYPNGVYNLILIYNNKRFNTKVIKQWEN